MMPCGFEWYDGDARDREPLGSYSALSVAPALPTTRPLPPAVQDGSADARPPAQQKPGQLLASTLLGQYSQVAKRVLRARRGGSGEPRSACVAQAIMRTFRQKYLVASQTGVLL